MKNGIQQFGALLIFLLFTATSCTDSNNASPTSSLKYPPTASPTTSFRSTITPTAEDTSIPTATKTHQPTPTSIPDCVISDAEGELYILNNQVFSYSKTDKDELDRALMNTFPQWASFRQKLEWRADPVSAGQVVEDASFEATFQLNPAVTLVTVGLHLNWELPSDGDLFSIARSAGEKLNGFYWDYAFDDVDDQTQIKADHPEVGNAATYSIYAFFEYDQSALKEWCDIYKLLFDKSPVNAP